MAHDAELDPNNQNAIKAIRRLEQEKAAPGAVRKTRVALVIGNADYKYGGRLANPVNDAGDFANVLRRLGFEVIEGRNLDKRGMDEEIAEFTRKLDKAGTGLFFYAGHGIQVDGVNWLIPVDAQVEGGDLRPELAAAVKTASINVTQVLSKMEAEQRVNLIFLDACRDNPFGRSTGFGPAKGLAPIQNAVGTLTAFSTKPDHVALDGDGRNSPFTTALLKHIPTPGLEIGAVMKRVRVDVIESTEGEQVPFNKSSLITDVVLALRDRANSLPRASRLVAARDKKDVRCRGTIVGTGDVEWTFDDKNESPAAHRDKDALEAAALAATIRIYWGWTRKEMQNSGAQMHRRNEMCCVARAAERAV